MSGNIMEKGIRFYKRYGIRGGIATLTGKCQIKDKDYEKWYEFSSCCHILYFMCKMFYDF